jgi:hypothetical protein
LPRRQPEQQVGATEGQGLIDMGIPNPDSLF